MHAFFNLHPSDGVEAVLGAKVLPPGRGNLRQGGSQVIVEIQEKTVRESRGNVWVLQEPSSIPSAFPRET